MIHDAACPEALSPPTNAVERHGVFFTSAQWAPESLERLADHLDRVGARALDRLDPARLLDAWSRTVGRFRDPASAESEALRPVLTRFCALSGGGLDAALDAVLGGVDRAAAGRLFTEARNREATRPRPASRKRGRLVAVVLAGNLPALAVQSLLPALARRRPVLLKSPTSEPLFAPAFVRALVRAEPALEAALAAVTWRGGDRALEAPVLERAGTVLAYGDRPAVDSISERTAGKCVVYGPKASLAVISRQADRVRAAVGLARDVALFDQRGCLSIQAVYTDGDSRALATALAAELAERAASWPAGPLDPTRVAAVQQLRLEARMRGLYQPALPLASGTVVVDPIPQFRPSPGLRTVRIHALQDLAEVVPRLAAWQGRLQGAALAGGPAWELESVLSELGISRCAKPGSLQSPDALWHNGGLHPFDALGASSQDAEP
ncbi:MAG: hypothetical protein O7A04_08960 [Acidobacteria bacterium]|nr:hypothetical protein [Acidobacteriota bacterium]